MLHIILGILKIIGILLAVVILLLLGIMFAVLFVPVRYKGTVVKTSQKLAADIRITWLMRMFSVMIAYDHGGKKKIIEIRLFGITLERILQWLNNLSDRKKKRAIAKEEKQKRKKDNHARSEKKHRTEEAAVRKIGSDIEKETETGIVSDTEEEPETGTVSDTEEEPETGIVSDTEEDPETGTVSDTEEDAKERESISQKPDWRGRMQTLYTKTKESVRKLKGLFEKMKRTLQRFMQIPDKISHILDRIGRVSDKIDRYQKLLAEYEAKELFDTIWKEVKHLLSCYIPRRVKGCLHFGTGDPAKTGQILGVLYVLLPVRASGFLLQPEFTDAVLETEMEISGHVRINHAAAAAWRLFRNKKLMRAIKMLKKERRT